MQNLWLAVDHATSPRAQARQLRRTWERLLGQGELVPRLDKRLGSDLREPIADSWRRSLEAGLDPDGWLAPVEADESEARALWEEHPLSSLSHALVDQLLTMAEDSRSLIVVSDAAGLLLHVQGAQSLREQAADQMNFREGARWSETAAGTNAVGTALAADHCVQVFASEHFNQNAHAWTCSAAPVHDPTTGRLVGVVDLTSPMETVHPVSLALAMTAATTMEQRLAAAQREHDARLLRRYGDLARATTDLLFSKEGRLLAGDDGESRARLLEIPDGGGEVVLNDGSTVLAEPLGQGDAYLLRRGNAQAGHASSVPTVRFEALGRDRAEAEVGGQEFLLTHRQSEVLVLLAEHPAGLTADQLAVALYGDLAKPVSARAEVSRLRNLLGVSVGTDPYRLEARVESDLGALRRLLRQGRILDAASLHADVLLPRSQAPGVVELREQLEAWTRHAVMTADDPDAIWIWVSSPSGADDLAAWVRFLSTVAYEDGRRALAAAHVKRLRRRFGSSSPSTAS